MVEPFLTAFWGAWGRIKAGFRWFLKTIRTQSRLQNLETELAALREARSNRHRKCPSCGERDFRLRDQYRYHPDIFQSDRHLHEKWLCYTCGYAEQYDIPEPGG